MIVDFNQYDFIAFNELLFQGFNLVEFGDIDMSEIIEAELGDTTPRVWGCGIRVNGGVLATPEGAAYDITYFDDGVYGQRLSVLFLGNNVTLKHDPEKLVLAGGHDVTPTAHSLLSFHNVNGVWYEDGRTQPAPPPLPEGMLLLTDTNRLVCIRNGVECAVSARAMSSIVVHTSQTPPPPAPA